MQTACPQSFVAYVRMFGQILLAKEIAALPWFLHQSCVAYEQELYVPCTQTYGYRSDGHEAMNQQKCPVIFYQVCDHLWILVNAFACHDISEAPQMSCAFPKGGNLLYFGIFLVTSLHNDFSTAVCSPLGLFQMTIVSVLYLQSSQPRISHPQLLCGLDLSLYQFQQKEIRFQTPLRITASFLDAQNQQLFCLSYFPRSK